MGPGEGKKELSLAQRGVGMDSFSGDKDLQLNYGEDLLNEL